MSTSFFKFLPILPGGPVCPARAGVSGTGLFVPLEQGFQVLASEAAGDLRHLFGGAGGDHPAARAASLGAEVDDIVGAFDQVEVVLDDNDGVAGIHQLLQHLDQPVDVSDVQPGGGLVQDIDRLAGRAAGQLVGQLDPLRLAARQGGGALPQGDVAEADVQQGLQFAGDLGLVGEKDHCFLHRHVQHIGDGLFLVLDLQGLAVVAGPLADLAGDVDVGQKVHLDLQNAVALAGFASAALDVEAEPPRPVPPHLGVLGLGKDGPDVVEHPGVGGGVGARGPPDGLLVDANHLVDVFQPVHPVALAGAAAGAVQLARQGLVQNFVDQTGFAAARNAGHAGEGPEGELHRDAAQVVLPGLVHPQAVAAAGAADGGHRDPFAARQIIAGNAPFGPADVPDAAGGHDLAAVHPRPRADVHDVVGGADGVLVVLDHDHRVAQVPQVLEGGDQLVVVPLVQADGGLVQHIQHPRQGAADLGGQPDALALAARQGAGRAGQGQVVEADALQKFQPGADLFQDLPADLALLIGQRLCAAALLAGPDEVQLLPDGHLAELADVDAPHRHRQHHRLEPLAFAGGAFHPRHHPGDLLFHPLAAGLAEAALEVFDNALELAVILAAAELVGPVQLQLFAVGAVEQGVARLGGKVPQRGVEGEAVPLAQRDVVHLADRALGVVPPAGLDGPLPDGQAAVGDDAVLIHLHEDAQAGALVAGALGVVEGKEPRGQLADRDAVLRAGEVLAEGHGLPADHLHLGHPAGQVQGRFQAVGQPAAHPLADDQPVHHHLDGVLDVLFQGDLLVQVVQAAVHLDPGVAGPPGGVQLFLLGALALPDHRRQHLKAGPLLQLQDGVHHLVHALLADDPAADRAVGHPDPGVEQPEVIVDLGHGAHRRAGVVAGGLLVDGDGRRQAGDLVDVGLVHPAQEHPGVAGQAFDIAALAVGIDGVEGEAGLARPRQPGHDDELFPREGQADVFQVVLPRALDDDLIVCQSIFFLFSVSVRGSGGVRPRRPSRRWGFRPGAAGRSGPAGRPRARIPAALPPPSSRGSAARWPPPVPFCPSGGCWPWRFRPCR